MNVSWSLDMQTHAIVIIHTDNQKKKLNVELNQRIECRFYEKKNLFTFRLKSYQKKKKTKRNKIK